MEFIDGRIQDLEASTRKFENEFGGLDPAMLDVKPAADRWSINECLDHLVQSNARYHAIFDDAAAGRIPANFWHKVPFVPGLWGSMILNSVKPQTVRKTKTFPVFMPLKSHYGRSVLPDLVAGNEALIARFRKLKNLDLDRTMVTSPTAKFVVYSLRHCLEILTEHEKRHFNQAVRVKAGISKAQTA